MLFDWWASLYNPFWCKYWWYFIFLSQVWTSLQSLFQDIEHLECYIVIVNDLFSCHNKGTPYFPYLYIHCHWIMCAKQFLPSWDSSSSSGTLVIAESLLYWLLQFSHHWIKDQLEQFLPSVPHANLLLHFELPTDIILFTLPIASLFFFFFFFFDYLDILLEH